MPSRAVVRFYNKQETAEQWIKEGKQAVKMTRLSCHRFGSNEVRLALPRRSEKYSLVSATQRLVKAGGRAMKHARCYWLCLAEGHLDQRRFGAMLGADRDAARKDRTGEVDPKFVSKSITASWVGARRCVAKSQAEGGYSAASVRIVIPEESCWMIDFSQIACRRNRSTMAAVLAVKKEIPGKALP
jgi:hypothetical protein